MVKVSIILPIYNVQDYLEKCLNSLTNQTLEDIEIICINDCSTDNSLKILEEFAIKDSRIIITNLIENKGQGYARNIGIELAKGEYIGFVDPDDWAELNMFEEMYFLAKKNNCELVECNHVAHNEIRNYKNTYKTKIHYPKNKCFNWKDMKITYPFYPPLAPWNKLYKTTLLKDNNIKFEETRLGEDQILAIKSRLLANNIIYTKKSLYNYRKRANSSVNKINKDTLLRPKLIYNVKEFLVQNDFWNIFENMYTEYAISGLVRSYGYLPEEWITDYENSIQEYFGEKFYKEYCKIKSKSNKNLFHNIFSIKNTNIHGIKYKNITILGLSFKTRYSK